MASTNVFQCTLCKVYFENYTSTTVHLAFRHPNQVRSVFNSHSESSNLRRNSRRSSGNSKDNAAPLSLIERKELSNPFVPLERLSPQSCIYRRTAADKTESRNSSRSTTEKSSVCLIKQLPDGRTEVKLDSLKASQIEALINNIYCHPVKSTSTLPVLLKKTESVTKNSRKCHPLRKRLSDSKTKKTDCSISINRENVITSTTTRKSRTGRVIKSRFSKEIFDVSSISDVDSESDASQDKAKGQRSKHQNDDEYEPEPVPELSTNGSEKPFECSLCQQRYPNQYSLKRHMNLHLENNPYECKFTGCGKKFISNYHLRRHAKLHTNNDKYRPKSNTSQEKFVCKYCKKEFHLESVWEQHEGYHKKRMTQDATEKPFECPLCQHRFLNQYNLRRHINLHLENNPFECKFTGCGKRFNSDYNLRRHAKLHRSRKFFKCRQCPAEYTTMQHVQRHEARYHAENSTLKLMQKPPGRTRRYCVKLIDENSPVSQESNATEATQVETTISPNRMDIRLETIPKLDADNDNVPEGRKRHENDTSRYYLQKDPVIQKLLKKQPELARSIFSPFQHNRNSKVGDFCCKKCDWTGPRLYFLQNHMKIEHNEELPAINNEDYSNDRGEINFLCGTCGVQSSSSEELSAHIKSAHGGEKKFRCSHCGKQFKTVMKKNQHELGSHIMEKKFKCNVCGNGFVSKTRLTVHKKKVHGKRWWKCDKCPKVLKTRGGLYVHRRQHFQEKSKCNICSQVCADIYSLRRHIQYVHLKVKNPYNERLMKRRTEEKRQRQKVMEDQQGKEADQNQSESSTESTSSNKDGKESPEDDESNMLLGL